MNVSDKTYTIDGQVYDRVTSVIDGTIGGQGEEALVCETAKHASLLWEKSQSGEVFERPVRVWDGGKFVEALESVSPAEALSDYRRLQGESFRVRQGWLDRGTVLNLLFDQFAKFAPGTDPTANNALDFVNGELASFKEYKGETPVPYQCDREDLLDRAMWLARIWRDVHPVVTHTQQTVKCDRLMVAGTLDAIGVINGKAGVIELKAGSEQFSHQVQASSYKHLSVGRKRFGVFLVYIRRDGYRIVELSEAQQRQGWQVFKQALPAYRIKSQRRKWSTLAQNSDKQIARKAS